MLNFQNTPARTIHVTTAARASLTRFNLIRALAAVVTMGAIAR